MLVTGDRRAAAGRLVADRLQTMTADEVLDSPFLLIRTEAQIATSLARLATTQATDYVSGRLMSHSATSQVTVLAPPMYVDTTQQQELTMTGTPIALGVTTPVTPRAAALRRERRGARVNDRSGSAEGTDPGSHRDFRDPATKEIDQ